VPFLVSADAFDWEDGPINNPDSYSWSSDKDGQLGTRSWLVVSTLSPGEHTLTVTVSDANGNPASASVQITIVALEASPNAAAPFHFPTWAWIVIGFLALLVFSVIGFILLRARK
ncbi:MAG: PKD domain-containing protein, partial [Chloroflexi bacterium]|nr:PKD domain-containing protein [Chloroflexota bacterium]